MNTYRFKIRHEAPFWHRGTVVYVGEVDIKAPCLEEAIYFFKQHRHELTEIPSKPLQLYPLGSDCSFTVEAVE